MLDEVLPQLAELTLTPLLQTLAHEAAQPQQQRHHHFARPSRTVPFAAREQWSRSVRRTCDELMAAINRGEEQSIILAFTDLLTLPSRALTDTRASRGRAQRACARLQRIDAGEALLNEEDGPDATAANHHDTQHKRAARAHRFLTLGSVSRASKSLEALPMAEPTPATLAALRDLHPAAAPPTVPATTAAPVTVTLEMLRNVLKALPRGSAPGPSGWTYEHIKAATNGMDSALEVTLHVINAIVSGALPHVPALLDSKLIGIEKPGGCGLRPIAIGEAWMRLAGLCAMAACPDAGRTLAPLQLGVGVSGGSHIIGHAISAGIAADPECVTIQLDWRNAFNSISRGAMLNAIAARQPTLLPFAAWTYKQAGRLFVDGMPEGTPPILSECGVRQGDPCGVLYFSITTQDMLEKMKLTHPGAPPLAYTDDTFLQGTSSAVTAAFPALCNLGAAIGLEVRLNKCGVYSRNAAAAIEAANILEVPHRAEGLLVAGTPVGTDEYITSHADSKSDDVAKFIDGLQDIPLPLQDKFIIMRASTQMRLAHLPRVAPWNLVGEAIQRMESKVAEATFKLMSLPVQPELLASQVTLPLRYGGMGIRATSSLEAKAAFLSAAAVTQKVMSAGPLPFRPFSGPMGPGLIGDWHALHSTAGDLWPTASREVDDACISEVLPKVQRMYSKFQAQSKSEQLLSSCHVDNEAGLMKLARLNSCSCRTASMWLDTLPTSHALQLSDADFGSAMRHRLGLSQMPSNAPGVQCSCNRFMQQGDLDHAMTCKSLSGVRTLRHDILKGIVRRISNRAGIASSVEPTLRTLPGSQSAAISTRPESRGDVLMVLPSGMTVVDVSVIHPAASSYLQAARTVGGAAAVRDAAKTVRYESIDPNGYTFVPISVETFGRLGKPAMELINKLAATAAAGGAVEKSAFMANALRELSVGLCRGNGVLYRSSLGVLARASGSAFMAGMTVPTSDVP